MFVSGAWPVMIVRTAKPASIDAKAARKAANVNQPSGFARTPRLTAAHKPASAVRIQAMRNGGQWL